MYWNATTSDRALALTVGMGLNLLATPDYTGSLITNPPAMPVWRAVGFAAHVVWRGCFSMPSPSSNATACIRDDLVPLLRGAYGMYATVLEGLSGDGPLHLAIPGAGRGSTDASVHLATLRWCCQTLLAVAAKARFGVVTDEPAVLGCTSILPRLVEPSLDETGALAWQPGVPFDGKSQFGIEFAYQVFPMALWTRYSHPAVVGRTADALMRVNCTQYGFCDDLVYTMRGGLNAAAGRGAAAAGNLTEFLNTDRRRLARNGSLFAAGCSRPCAHCQPCVGPNTMVEEGSNPILEGGPALAANVQDMLLQDFVLPQASLDDTGDHFGGVPPATLLLAVFPAIPSSWATLVFYRFRALGALLVSARRSAGVMAWVQLEAQSTDLKSCIVEANFDIASSSDIKARASATGITIAPVRGSQHRVIVQGLRPGVTVLLYAGQPPDSNSLLVVPLQNSSQDAFNNYYGFRRP